MPVFPSALRGRDGKSACILFQPMRCILSASAELRFLKVLLVVAMLLLFASIFGTRRSALAGEKRLVTVEDGIRMTRLADAEYLSGSATSKGRVAHFSPDGSRFAVVLRKGNLENNTNEDSLLLYETSKVFHSPKPDVLLTMSSSSNLGAINNIRWLPDNGTIAFLGEKPGETSQVYAFDITTRELKKLTEHPTSVSFYDITPDGREIIYVADPPPKNVMNSEQTRREGIVISDQMLADVLAGDAAPSWWEPGEQLFLKKQGEKAVPVRFEDFLYPEGNFLSLSPDGRYALIRSWVRDETPGSWTGYESEWVRTRVTGKRRGALNTGLMRFLLLDTAVGSVEPLIDTPMEWYNDTARWAPDSQSIFLTTRLPLDVQDRAQFELRRKNFFNVRVALPNKEIQTNRILSFQEMVKEEIEKRGIEDASVKVAVSLEEDMNTPPKIYVSGSKTREKVLLLDLNPQLEGVDFHMVESVIWKAADGHEVQGGLYLPFNYVPGKRYPLVIQTHGFDPSRFSIDGNDDWSTGFAARPLASAGFVVLQIHGPITDQEGVDNTPREGPAAMGVFEGAIDYLDSRGLVDLHQVGITGFSRTVFYVAYALTHSKYRFSAAVLTDGVDAGYFQYMVFREPGQAGLNGGSPFGPGLLAWLKNSPGFNLDRVHTPVRLVAHGPSSVLGAWEWFSGLSVQEKPVDFIYLPDATHLIVKPWERLTEQQGSVDWYRFWLKGEEDTNPRKASQYARWRNQRDLNHKEVSVQIH
jgi:dipeptidyl aminopeptidase/acylaminoacyl peptidase